MLGRLLAIGRGTVRVRTIQMDMLKKYFDEWQELFCMLQIPWPDKFL